MIFALSPLRGFTARCIVFTNALRSIIFRRVQVLLRRSPLVHRTAERLTTAVGTNNSHLSEGCFLIHRDLITFAFIAVGWRRFIAPGYRLWKGLLTK